MPPGGINSNVWITDMDRADIRGIDIAMLRAFDALLRERSVSRAASRLFLSQPAVSASLKRLREAFDDPLFTRTPHGIAPTPFALALAPRVEAVLNDLQGLLNMDRAFDPATSDRILRVSGSDHSSRAMLPLLCRELTACGSHIRLAWELADYSQLPERLRKGDIDLGLLPRMAPAAGVESELLYEDTYLAVARRGHPRYANGMDLEGFCAMPHVVLGQSRSMLDDTIDQILARRGLVRHLQTAVTTFSQMTDLVASTDAIAVFPQRVASRYAELLDALPLPFELPSYRLYVCWNARSDADEAVRWLREAMVRLGRMGH
ncbi:LysR family transcriptional regulator [Variovorax sp. J22P240]|uniref:LysR family transcriptional regulator n=1 Tax=Variovorax sp. J22P240 TaxID=3053514 RepID=UPI002576C130|nr:LysR family transcriptional regulator [Variovorax sp. J22P240]MDM0001081.1 LysR family transcriptional regulator [Variovorax sp. J22P240]